MNCGSPSCLSHGVGSPFNSSSRAESVRLAKRCRTFCSFCLATHNDPTAVPRQNSTRRCPTRFSILKQPAPAEAGDGSIRSLRPVPPRAPFRKSRPVTATRNPDAALSPPPFLLPTVLDRAAEALARMVKGRPLGPMFLDEQRNFALPFGILSDSFGLRFRCAPDQP